MEKNLITLKNLVILFLASTTISAYATTLNSEPNICISPDNIPKHPLIGTTVADENVRILADIANFEMNSVSILEGNVEGMQNKRLFRTDRMEFHQPDNTANLIGNVQYWDQSVYVQADKGSIQFDTNKSQMQKARYVIKENYSHGESEYIELDIGTETRLKNAQYSFCDPKNQFWSLSSTQIILDHTKELGKASNVLIKIKNIPVFYTPYLAFPLGKKRKTGFLVPTFRHSNSNGFETSIPFYWNIQPHIDATITPRLLSKRNNALLIGELRHLSKNSHSKIQVEQLFRDAKFDDKSRGITSVKHLYQFSQKGEFSIDYNRVSDNEYFQDFGNTLDESSTRLLDQQANISYQDSWWDASIALKNYQLADQTITADIYQKLPQIQFNAYSASEINKPLYEFNFEFNAFRRNNDHVSTPNQMTTTNLDIVSASRLDVASAVSYPYKTKSMFLKPKFTLHYSKYNLENANIFSPGPSRFLPIANIDSGLFLERNFPTLKQTLEPRLFYLYIPKTDQTDLPIFDTHLHDLSFDGLFRENRFNGSDRIGDANQLTLALTSRLIEHDTGKERGYLRLGQIYYFDQRDVTLPDTAIKTNDYSSPIILETKIAFFNHWKFRGDIQWNAERNQTEKVLAQLQYKTENNQVFNLNHRLRNTPNNTTTVDIEQSDISFYWALNNTWDFIGKWNYSISAKRILEVFGGFKYSTCCVGLQLVARQFLTGNNKSLDTGVFLQLDLKGLTKIGNKNTNIFTQKIIGYEN